MARSWEDLKARVISGLALVAIGALVIWAGGLPLQLVLCAVVGGMIWELTRLLDRDSAKRALAFGAAAAVTLFISLFLPVWLALQVLLLPAAAGLVFMPQHRGLFFTYAAPILLAGLGVILLRNTAGLGWMLWLVSVVVATDVAGYFAGRAFGGPKFWPRISPKKTWSGTAGGWVAAALVGAAFAGVTGFGTGLILLSVAVSFASQLGDIAESALKRLVGAKDSSNLIPGHGGLLDRFDGMLGGAVFLYIVGPLAGVPVGL